MIHTFLAMIQTEMYNLFVFSAVSVPSFLALMMKVSKSPLVTDILNIPGVQKSLEHLANLLGKIQKALGEYLERERANFSGDSVMVGFVSLMFFW